VTLAVRPGLRDTAATMTVQSTVVLFSAALAAGCAAAPQVVQPLGWLDVDAPVAASLRGLAAVDAQIAYVGGSGGALLRTDDGGASWRDVAPAGCEDCDFRDVEALDERRVVAMVAGQPARIYHSDDGGASWRIAHQDPRAGAFFDAIAFGSCAGNGVGGGELGVAFGDAIDGAFVALATDDGGRSWRSLGDDALAAPREGEAAFAASGTCVVALPGGPWRFGVATGGGERSRLIGWTPGAPPVVCELPLASGAASRGAFSLAGRGGSLVVVGGDYERPEQRDGTACWSDDGARTWHRADAGGYRSAVAWLDDDTLLAVGSDGASVSRNRGRSWRPFGDVGFHAVAVARDGAVWVCGSDGRVARLLVAR